jgi:hypothetical protein
MGGWVAMSTVLLLVATTGGFWLRRRAVRDLLLEDEGSRAHRASARVGRTTHESRGSDSICYGNYRSPTG